MLQNRWTFSIPVCKESYVDRWQRFSEGRCYRWIAWGKTPFYLERRQEWTQDLKYKQMLSILYSRRVECSHSERSYQFWRVVKVVEAFTALPFFMWFSSKPYSVLSVKTFSYIMVYLHHCFSHGIPSLSPSILVLGQLFRKKIASSHEVIWEQYCLPSHLNRVFLDPRLLLLFLFEYPISFFPSSRRSSNNGLMLLTVSLE